MNHYEDLNGGILSPDKLTHAMKNIIDIERGVGGNG
jgi:hypothetical protein